MTLKEKEVLQYIILFKTVNQYAPSIREICEGVHCSNIGTIKEILERLREDNYITYQDRKPRTIVVKQFNIE